MHTLLTDTPALVRLRWLLDGLDGRWSVKADVGTALAPGFVAPGVFVSVVKGRAEQFAPIRVIGVDVGVDGQSATARFRTRGDDLWVSHVNVEASGPHGITSTYTQRWVPDYMTPGLPADFTGVVMPAVDDAVFRRVRWRAR
jgi:hypothetical protein